jgi:mannose-6-phosphate isomerase-like protein (cupin superfamily)
MDARGAILGGDRSAPPPPAPIRKTAADRVNLGLMGFEAEGFGIDRRSIAPGEVVPRPSTGGNRWMVLCRKGEVVVHRAATQAVPLRAGEMSFIPAGVVFEVRNSSHREASFDLVYAKKVEPPSHSHSR